MLRKSTMSLNLKIFALAICCSIISHYSLVYGQQPSSNAVDYDAEFSKICTLLSSDPYNAELYSKLKVLPGKLPDINEQCRCAAIYCLAVSVAGNSTEASKAMRFIEKKNPNSEYLQRLSGNNLSENCPNCNGKGTITSQCKTCGGSGQCSTCNGNGSRPGIGNTSIKCPACMGAGKCKQCNGTGDTTQKCQKCGGKGRILSIQSIKSEYLALLKERSGKQSNIAVATGRDVKDEQKKEESVTKKPFVETAVYKSKDGGLDYGQNPYEGREGAKGSHIAKQKESGQHQIELSDDSKSTSALANKSENDCDQQYGKPLKRTVLDDGYVEAIYEKKNTTINIIFNKDGCIDCISYLSNEPFTEEQRKVLIENYSINKEE